MSGGEDNDGAYCTQGVREKDNEVFSDLEEQLGQLDRTSFELELVQLYKNEEDRLNDTRFSLYEVAKDRCEDVPRGFISKRVQRGHSKKTVIEKYASDVFILYSFITGAVSAEVVQKEVLSRQKQKNSEQTICDEEKDEDDVLKSAHMKEAIGFLLSKVMAISDHIQENSNVMENKIETLHQKFDTDMLRMIRALEEKNEVLVKATAEIEKARNTEMKLRGDIQILVAQLRDKDRQIAITREEFKSTVEGISRKSVAIEGKIDTINSRFREIQSGLIQQSRPNTSTWNTDTNQVIKLSYAESVKTPPKAHKGVPHVSPEITVLNDSVSSGGKPTFDGAVDNDSETSHNGVEERPETEHKHIRHNQPCNSQHVDSPVNQQDNRNVKFDNEWERAFKGISPKFKKKRFVLSRVSADKPFELVQDAIVEYARKVNVIISSVTLLKKWEGYYPTYTIRINVGSQSADKVIEDTFWPQNVRCREWIPRSKRQ